MGCSWRAAGRGSTGVYAECGFKVRTEYGDGSGAVAEDAAPALTGRWWGGGAVVPELGRSTGVPQSEQGARISTPMPAANGHVARGTQWVRRRS
ncbi:MAG: hypothetical protein ACK58T_43940 [Phycisphaerae bacterium]